MIRSALRRRLALLLAGFVFAGVASADGLPDAPHIAVRGSHRMEVVPDRLRMTLTLRVTDPDVAVAVEQVEERSSRLIEALRKLGIAKRDISSAQLSVTPHYNWQKRAQIYAGTDVSRAVVIVLRKLEKYHELVRVVIDAQVGEISGTHLEYSDEQAVRRTLLQGALQDAHEKAELLLSGVPEQLGAIHSISSLGAPGNVRERGFFQASKAGKSFEPGTIEISEQLSVVYYLER